MPAAILGRRNLTRDQWEYLLGRRYNRKKTAVGVRGPEKLDQNEPASTAEVLAAEYGVSPATVKRAGKTAAFLDEHPKEKVAVLNKRKRLRTVKEDPLALGKLFPKLSATNRPVKQP